MISAAHCCVLALPIQMLHFDFRVSKTLKTFDTTYSVRNLFCRLVHIVRLVITELFCKLVKIVEPVTTELICKLIHYVRPVITVLLCKLVNIATAKNILLQVVFFTFAIDYFLQNRNTSI